MYYSNMYTLSCHCLTHNMSHYLSLISRARHVTILQRSYHIATSLQYTSLTRLGDGDFPMVIFRRRYEIFRRRYEIAKVSDFNQNY